MLKSYETIGLRLGMLVMPSVPSISVILAFIFLDEVLSLIQLIAIFITTTGIAIVVLQKK